MNIVSELLKTLRLFPGRIAISEDERVLTYRDLYSQSLKVANYLARQNIQKRCIAIAVNNKTDHIIAIIGVIISGNYYVSVTEENSFFFTSENEFPVALTICTEAGFLPRPVSLETVYNESSASVPRISIDPEDKICAFFTSGSTGKSKMVVHNHQSIFTRLMHEVSENEITFNDRLDLVFSISFSASLSCIFPALLSGAALYIFNLKNNGIHQLVNFWDTNNITFTTLSVSTFQGVCKITPSMHHLTALRFVCISAEPVKDTTVAFFKEKFPSATILQIAYATTETRTIAELKIFNNGRPTPFQQSIGKAVTNREIHIIDERGTKQAIGIIGEIVVESAFIADGYYGQHDESAGSFIRNGKHIQYKTGDLGYLNKEGYLFYCGRKVNETKINGVKLSIASIEEKIENINGILQAVVVVNKANPALPKLVCFYTNNGITPTDKAIKNILTKQLPLTHVPGFYIQLDQFHVTHTGKIDRKYLENLTINEVTTNTDHAEATTGVPGHYEAVIITVFSRILETTGIDAGSNFFDFGGSSLTALLCVAQIEEQLNISFPSIALIDNPTPGKLSTFLLQTQNRQADVVKAVNLNGYCSTKENIFFLSHAMNNQYDCFKESPLAARFNLVQLFYELNNSDKTKNADIIINQLATITGKHENTIVVGHSFNGYIAHQLACIVPQITYCVLIDTFNYFEYEKYEVSYGLRSKIKFLLWQIRKNKDYSFPLYWFKIIYSQIFPSGPKSKLSDHTDGFINGLNYLLENLNQPLTINNGIYFKANHTCICNKSHGLDWKPYIQGDFHSFNFHSHHDEVIDKNVLTMAEYIIKVTDEKR